MSEAQQCGWCGAEGVPLKPDKGWGWECEDDDACAARLDEALKEGDPSTYEGAMRGAWYAAGQVVQEARHHRQAHPELRVLWEKIDALEAATPPGALAGRKS
jgi:hypothetical protein